MLTPSVHSTHGREKSRVLLALCGPSGVGKTTISRALQQYGYSIVSASHIASEMYDAEHGRSPTARELAEFGVSLLSSVRERDFLERILAVLTYDGNVVVDGLRSMLTLEHLQTHRGAITVLIDRALSLRRLRSNALGEVDVELVRVTAEVDSYLSLTGFQFDLNVNNDTSVADSCAAILSMVNEIAGQPSANSLVVVDLIDPAGQKSE